MADFKVGDIVYLKSGSHPMTVTEIMSKGNVYVSWYNEYGQERNAFFPPEALTKKDTKPKAPEDKPDSNPFGFSV